MLKTNSSHKMQMEIRSFYLRIKRAKALIFFIGKKINRLPLVYDRNILRAQGFRLIKANNLRLASILGTYPIFQNLSQSLHGYSLIAMSLKTKKLSNIGDVFNLPYSNVIPISAVSANVYYTAKRISNHNFFIKNSNLISLMIGLPPFFIFVVVLQNFLYETTKRMFYSNIY